MTDNDFLKRKGITKSKDISYLKIAAIIWIPIVLPIIVYALVWGIRYVQEIRPYNKKKAESVACQSEYENKSRDYNAKYGDKFFAPPAPQNICYTPPPLILFPLPEYNGSRQ